jgi:hypothetical protein
VRLRTFAGQARQKRRLSLRGWNCQWFDGIAFNWGGASRVKGKAAHSIRGPRARVRKANK